jgi:SAM-dependent methyltransferase
MKQTGFQAINLKDIKGGVMKLETTSSGQELETGHQAVLQDQPDVLQERQTWNGNFKESQYSEVISVTGCPEFRQSVASYIDGTVRRVLIPGCGSEPFLAKHILENCPGVDLVVTTDWAEEAIRLSESKYTHPKLVYKVKDTSKLSAETDGQFDIVININAILSNNDLLNRAMVAGCHRVLVSGGLFYGLFPDVLCSVELGSMVTELSELIDTVVDLKNSTFFEQRQGMSQIFYTPQRLKRVLSSVGFQLSVSDVSRRALDGEYFISEYERLYGFNNSDLVIWENEVVLIKP